MVDGRDLSKRPLSLTELRFAMASDWPNPLCRPHQLHCEWEKSKEFVESDERMKTWVRTLSGGLVEVKHQKKERIVQLIRVEHLKHTARSDSDPALDSNVLEEELRQSTKEGVERAVASEILRDMLIYYEVGDLLRCITP
jgi:hypothetical protein